MLVTSVRCCGTLLLILIPNASDYTLDVITERPLSRALIDNVTHGIIAAMTWLVFDPTSVLSMLTSHSSSFSPKSGSWRSWTNVLTVLIVSCLIDVDHFVSAKSLDYKDALKAPHRGLFHCSGLMLLLNLILLCVNFDWALIFLVSWFSHHLRDASRRGIYLHPPQIHTRAIPPHIVTFLTIAFPWILIFLSNKLNKLNQPPRQVFNI